MKYSIRGNTFINDNKEIISLANEHSIWNINIETRKDESENDSCLFEIRLNDIEESHLLFDKLKPIINANGGWMDWHECYNDEIDMEKRKSCVIQEEYRGDN